MSIDFDSAALQTQHEEEEYDQEDYAREQELQKLLTDLPDDMLEDSRDSSSPELEYSTCSNKNTGNSPQSSHPQQWSAHPRINSHQQNYEAEYDQPPVDDYSYEDAAAQANMRRNHPGPPGWSQQAPDHQFSQGDYTYTSVATEKSTDSNDFSTDQYDYKTYPQGSNNMLVYNRGENYGEHNNNNARNHFQELKSGPGDRGVDQYKARYSPHHPAPQPSMFNPQAAQQEAQLDHLQREFLDSTQQTADREQLAQVQILNKAQQRQIADLEQKLQDVKRNMRCVEHQFAIVRDEKDGLTVSLKESSRLVEEAKEREAQLLQRLKAMEQQVKVLTEKDQENLKKQRVADAAVDSMKQQMLELCRSDTLSKAREQHDRDLSVMKEQHDTAVLTLQQKLDSTSQALSEQIDGGQRLREQVRQLERQREEEQLERARVINGLTQRLEESQQQCAKLLQTSSVQETTQMQIKLQQAQSAKALSENMNQALQEDLTDLKEQITLYESAVKHGVITLDLNSDWENQLTDSCLDLGLNKNNRKNAALHSPALAHLSDSKLPKEDAVRLLRAEMQRCLGSLKGKRQRISQLQDELQLCQGRASELQAQLEEAKLGSAVRESSQVKLADLPAESQKELLRLQEDKRRLQEQLEVLEKKNKELKQSEEKVKSANTELCTKMREMIQELDQEKQEASQRTERIHQQFRDDVVQRVRTELRQEHEAELEQLTSQHRQKAQELQSQLSEASDKMLAVQECYISVCKEKSELEERVHSLEELEASLRQTEQSLTEQRDRAVETLRTELEAQHQASVQELKALWAEEQQAELQLQLDAQVASAKAAWDQELHKTEQTWAQRLEEARRRSLRETADTSCQAEELFSGRRSITEEELESRLQQLQLEADRVRHKAVEEARKHSQRELHKKHLEDMAKQVEGAVTRAYSRWIEDLTSLPEYRASLQAAQETWEEEHEKHTEQKVSQALKEAEQQWLKKHKQQEEQSCGAEQLQEEVAALQTRLEQERSEQAALLQAELAAARASWTRDKQQEISSVQARGQKLLHGKLQEQRRALELEARRAGEEAELQRKELLLQAEARLQQSQEESRRQLVQRERALREEQLSELQRSLEQVQAQLLRDPRTEQQEAEDIRRSSGSSSGAAVAQMINTSCRDMVSRAVSQAKQEWKRVSEETLGRVLKETQQHHEREIDQMQSSQQARSDTVAKLQEKNQELQRHLEKACRQLQHSVRQHKAATQRLKEEHESSLQKAKEEHLQQLEEVKRAKEERASEQQSLQQGLEEMKQQYLSTVEKIRGDMLRYLQESRQRAAEMIQAEVQRERQDTARKMRRYYLSCLQELLQEGGQSTGAETKIMNAASKLAAMAKVLETPTKSKPAKSFSPHTECPPGGRAGTGPSTPPELPGPEEKKSSEQRHASAARSRPAAAAAHTALRPHTHSQQATAPSLQLGPARASSRTRSRDVFLQGVEAPVQPEKPSDWSLSSGPSDPGFQAPRLSQPGRKVEPVRPFSVSATSDRDLGEFGLLSPDVSDVTVYNEIAKKTPHSHREPTPGSEADRQQPGSCSGQRVFSELRQRQQDSGFHSPFYPPK